MPKKVEMVLQSSEPVKPMELPQKPPKFFCVDHATGRAFLKDLILMVGAFREIEDGKADESQVKILSKKAQEFLVGIGDQLMIDTGLNEKDIEGITKELNNELKKR